MSENVDEIYRKYVQKYGYPFRTWCADLDKYKRSYREGFYAGFEGAQSYDLKEPWLVDLYYAYLQRSGSAPKLWKQHRQGFYEGVMFTLRCQYNARHGRIRKHG